VRPGRDHDQDAATHSSRAALHDAVDKDRFDKLDRVANRLERHEEKRVTSGLPGREEDRLPIMASVTVLADWLARHRLHKLPSTRRWR
jgi:hypothetical protein